jgi:hypothetical protein
MGLQQHVTQCSCYDKNADRRGSSPLGFTCRNVQVPCKAAVVAAVQAPAVFCPL